MAGNTKRYPKLRFALITEDALEMLRPETKTQDPNFMEVKDMYETITNTVNVMLEQKLRNLRLDKLDQLIEDKVIEIRERHREIRKNVCGLRTPKSSISDASSSPVTTIKVPDVERPIRTKKHKGMRLKKFQNEPFTTHFPFKTTPKSHEHRPTSTAINNNAYHNHKRGNANRSKRNNSVQDIPAQYIKDR